MIKACVLASAVLIASVPLCVRAQPSTDDAPLAGPKVDRPRAGGSTTAKAEPSMAGPPTLVHRDFDGRLKRLESHPVSAALDVIPLSDEEKRAAMAPVLDRSLAIEKIIRENLRLVLEAQNAFKPGDDGSGQRALTRLYQLAQPVFGTGKLLDLAAEKLPDDKARELRRVVGEYMDAAIADRMAGNADGKKADRLGAFIAENAALFGKEIEHAARRAFDGGEREFAELSRRLDLTPEQESKIQGMFISMATAQNGQPSKWKKMQTLLGAYALLTDEQRAKLREYMAEEARANRKPAKQQGSK